MFESQGAWIFTGHAVVKSTHADGQRPYRCCQSKYILSVLEHAIAITRKRNNNRINTIPTFTLCLAILINSVSFCSTFYNNSRLCIVLLGGGTHVKAELLMQLQNWAEKIVGCIEDSLCASAMPPPFMVPKHVVLARKAGPFVTHLVQQVINLIEGEGIVTAVLWPCPIVRFWP